MGGAKMGGKRWGRCNERERERGGLGRKRRH